MVMVVPAAWSLLLLLPSTIGHQAGYLSHVGGRASNPWHIPRRSAIPIVMAPEPQLRIGHGYDIHRLASREEAGQPIVIGGVAFDGNDAPDSDLGCVAHSDGDVIYHSLVDAILGALTMPDIGQLFPDNDPRLRGVDSEMFMVEAYDRMRTRGYAVGNVDVTLICQKPRINVWHPGKARDPDSL